MLMAILQTKIRVNEMKIPTRKTMRILRSHGKEQRRLSRLNPDGNLRALKLMELQQREPKDGNPRNVKAAQWKLLKTRMNVLCLVN